MVSSRHNCQLSQPLQSSDPKILLALGQRMRAMTWRLVSWCTSPSHRWHHLVFSHPRGKCGHFLFCLAFVPQTWGGGQRSAVLATRPHVYPTIFNSIALHLLEDNISFTLHQCIHQSHFSVLHCPLAPLLPSKEHFENRMPNASGMTKLYLLKECISDMKKNTNPMPCFK